MDNVGVNEALAEVPVVEEGIAEERVHNLVDCAYLLLSPPWPWW